MDFRTQFPGCHPRVGIPTVGILSVMLRVRFSHIIHSLRHLACRNRIAVHFDPAPGSFRRSKELCSVFYLKSQKCHLMTGILPLKQKHLMGTVFCRLIYGDFNNSFPIIRQAELCLLPVQNTAEIILPICFFVSHIYFQRVACKTHPHRRTGEYEHRGSPIPPVHSSRILQILMLWHDQHFFPPFLRKVRSHSPFHFPPFPQKYISGRSYSKIWH